MSITLKVSNGQVELNANNGQPKTVKGERKCAQDLAESILQDFDPEQGYGSFINQMVNNPLPFVNEIMVRNEVSNAVRNLQAKQQEDVASDEDERISKIVVLTTATDDSGSAAFYLRVETESGKPADATLLQPTQLNHLTETF